MPELNQKNLKVIWVDHWLPCLSYEESGIPCQVCNSEGKLKPEWELAEAIRRVKQAEENVKKAEKDISRAESQATEDGAALQAQLGMARNALEKAEEFARQTLIRFYFVPIIGS